MAIVGVKRLIFFTKERRCSSLPRQLQKMTNSPRTRQIRRAWLAWKRPSFLSLQLMVVESTGSKPATTAVYWVRPTVSKDGQTKASLYSRRPPYWDDARWSVQTEGGALLLLLLLLQTESRSHQPAGCCNARRQPSIHPSFFLSYWEVCWCPSTVSTLFPPHSHSQYVSAIVY